jgi:hypothetical protein
MKRNNVLYISALILFILAIMMIHLGYSTGPKVLLPPVITGIGFMVIAGVFVSLREK